MKFNKSKVTAPAPCTITKFDKTGSQIAQETVVPTVTVRAMDWTPDSVQQRYRLIAVQETGEEMFVGHASKYARAEQMRDAWLDRHPEHRAVYIETL